MYAFQSLGSNLVNFLDGCFKIPSEMKKKLESRSQVTNLEFISVYIIVLRLHIICYLQNVRAIITLVEALYLSLLSCGQSAGRFIRFR